MDKGLLERRLAGDDGAKVSKKKKKRLLATGAVRVALRSPLIEALRARHLDVARLLLQAGADPGLRDSSAAGACAAHFATCIYAIQEKEARVAEQVGKDNTGGALTVPRVSKSDSVALLRDMLDAKPKVANKKDDEGNTPLHWAFFHSAPPEIIRALVDQGAVLDSVNNEGQAPLDINPDLEW